MDCVSVGWIVFLWDGLYFYGMVCVSMGWFRLERTARSVWSHVERSAMVTVDIPVLSRVIQVLMWGEQTDWSSNRFLSTHTNKHIPQHQYLVPVVICLTAGTSGHIGQPSWRQGTDVGVGSVLRVVY